MSILLGLALAWCVGWSLLACCDPGRRGEPWRWFAAVLVGLTATAQIFLGAALVSPDHRWPVSIVLELIVVAAGVARLRHAARRSGPALTGGRWPMTWQALIALQMLLVGAVVMSRIVERAPFGDWDGWAIWNMHARLLVRAPHDWLSQLRQPALAWSHPDYPWGLSAGVARIWVWAGHESGFGAGAIGILYGLGAVGLLIAGLAAVRGWNCGLLAGIVLLATPAWIQTAGREEADVPLGAMMLAAALLMTLYERSRGKSKLAAAWGLVVGLACGVKNEGWLLAVAQGILWAGLATWNSRAAAGNRAKGWIYWLGFGIGAAPSLLFKVFLSPRNDLVSSAPGHRLAAVLSWDRHAQILRALRRDIFGFGMWHGPAAASLGLIALVVIAGVALRIRNRVRLQSAEVAAGVLLAAMLGGYYVVYLLTPYDLNWHLSSSLVRLLLQLWPTALFGLALLAGGAEAEPAPKAVSAGFAVAWFAANLAVALILGLALSHQRREEEFTANFRGGHRQSLVAGEGWFDFDWRGRTMGARSDGRAQLVLATPGGEPVARTTFALRHTSAGPVTIRITSGGRVVWHGEVTDAPTQIQLPDVAQSGGQALIEVAADGPLPTTAHRQGVFELFDAKIDLR